MGCNLTILPESPSEEEEEIIVEDEDGFQVKFKMILEDKDGFARVK